MNTTTEDKEIVIDFDLPLGQDMFELYKERMLVVYDLAEKAPDYCSFIIMDHGIILRTIESRRKRQEDILKSIEKFREFYCEYLKSRENDTFKK